MDAAEAEALHFIIPSTDFIIFSLTWDTALLAAYLITTYKTPASIGGSLQKLLVIYQI